MKKLFLFVAASALVLSTSALAQNIGGGDITFTPKNARPVVFSHEMHVKNKGLKCTGCHYQIFHMAKGSYKMDMAKLTKGDFCGKCHNGQKSFDVKSLNNCMKCHK
jgi:c(7)-type cytochrome triheme protein